MKSVFIFTILFISILGAAFSQDTITYNMYFPNAVHHEAEISVSLSNIDAEEITAIMSTSSPGRYSEHNFAKNIYNLKAYGDESLEVSMQKTESNEWKISGINNSLLISYTLYANHADGTYSGIDANFANINMPSSLLWVKGMEENPVKIIFHMPDNATWKIATQLTLLDSNKNVYAAPDLYYLMDSPCILSDFALRKLDSDQNNGFNIQMALYTTAADKELNQFAKMTQSVINEQREIFGEFPVFMDSSYTFLCSYGPGMFGDGMEHRNSTMIASAIPLAGNQNRLIGTISHEFFHCWNMERIRPKSLEPFDFTKANLSGELWFGEGFTSYYGDLIPCRSGLIEEGQYMNGLAQKLNYFVNAPGWKFGSPVDMSKMAVYTDGASAIDETNFANSYLSYYVYGEIIALALDLSLRTEFEEVSLDDLMKAMWETYGKEEIPYTNQDIQNTLAKLCDDQEFAAEFFESFIFGNQLPDFEDLFDKVGYKLVRKNPGRPSLGFVGLSFAGDTATLLSQPLIESALYEAGVNKNDLILSIDGQPVTSYPELNFIVGTRKVGDEIDISYAHLGELKTGSFKLKEDNQIILIPKEKFSFRVIEEEEALRASWLNSRVKSK